MDVRTSFYETRLIEQQVKNELEFLWMLAWCWQCFHYNCHTWGHRGTLCTMKNNATRCM